MSETGLKSVSLKKIDDFLRNYYRISEIEDASINGIQFPGAEGVSRVAVAVDACLDTVRAARQKGCQMLLCHHGMWWKGAMDRPVDRLLKARLAELIAGNITLYGIHLPMDMHEIKGHNAVIINALGVQNREAAFPSRGNDIGMIGSFAKPLSVAEINERLLELGIVGECYCFGKDKIQTVGVVSGGGAGETAKAAQYGLDLFISGEFNHQSSHIAREAGLNIIKGGHYATETPGIYAVAELLQEEFDIETVFIDNPTSL